MHKNDVITHAARHKKEYSQQLVGVNFHVNSHLCLPLCLIFLLFLLSLQSNTGQNWFQTCIHEVRFKLSVKYRSECGNETTPTVVVYVRLINEGHCAKSHTCFAPCGKRRHFNTLKLTTHYTVNPWLKCVARSMLLALASTLTVQTLSLRVWSVHHYTLLSLGSPNSKLHSCILLSGNAICAPNALEILRI